VFSYSRSLALPRFDAICWYRLPHRLRMARLPQRGRRRDDAGDRSILDFVYSASMHGSTSCSMMVCSTKSCSRCIWSGARGVAVHDSACISACLFYLPFMILPLYATSLKWSRRCWRRKRFGSSPRQAVLAGDVSAVLAGRRRWGIAVLHSDRREFVIPDLLAGSIPLMIGQTLWLEVFTNKDGRCFGGGRGAAAAAGGAAGVRMTGCSAASWRARDDGPRRTGDLFQSRLVALGLAFLYLPS